MIAIAAGLAGITLGFLLADRPWAPGPVWWSFVSSLLAAWIGGFIAGRLA
jgi:hypothetical protein